MTHEQFVRAAQAENKRLLEKAQREGKETLPVLQKNLQVIECPIGQVAADVKMSEEYLKSFEN